ncbi:sucrose nonfermenting 4-like protein isoform X3 [Vitis riparia]|uniref:sucrose nonfermenting 4-like protein isoform X3 n=1 Tax=Vitis riparia TaxID=96939 RepID=UPI00155A1888|nr:sucrose nonfermenting 4-like protein isoform X3 [Vitis riparia]
MFVSGAESGHENSAIPGTVLIPTRFVWPYGGRRVLLSGSFTRWSEHIPMSPIEGCPTVFQVIWSLAPGYHQYKFFVDGEWRHDEHQPFVSGNYGVVNTIFLPREPDVVPAVFSPDTPGGSNMDLDNDPFPRGLGNHGSNLTEEELETHTISAWKEGKLHLRQIDGSGRLCPRHLVHAGPYDSLKDVTLKILQNKVATVPIIHSASQDGSFPQLLHLASLSGILKCICRHFRHSSSSLPILQQPICSIPVGTWVPKIGESNGQPFAMLRPNASLGAALSLLVQAEVSSIPIVDDNDSLLDIYSRSDITALAKDRAYAQIHLDNMSIHQALQLGQDANSPYGFISGQRCQMCLRSDPLHKVMERLANPGVRRLVIVEAGSKRVEGVISLSDVFRFLLG